MSGGASSPVPAGHPLMRAWNAYKATEDYANTRTWAGLPPHTEGSLWSAFERGWRAGGGLPPFQEPEADGAESQRDLLRAALVGLVGVDGRGELEQIELAMRTIPAPEADTIASLNAIHALIATVPTQATAEPPAPLCDRSNRSTETQEGPTREKGIS